MAKKSVPLSLLESYVMNGEVAYQVTDELMEFAHGRGDVNTGFLLNEIRGSECADVVEGEEYLGDTPYSDLVHWSTGKDTLVLLSSGVMLALPEQMKMAA